MIHSHPLYLQLQIQVIGRLPAKKEDVRYSALCPTKYRPSHWPELAIDVVAPREAVVQS